MYRRSIGLTVAFLLFLGTSAFTQIEVAVTQDCLVEILSVTLNKSTLCIGETLQVNVTYNLLYNRQDPLAVGGVTVSISAAGEEESILTSEYVDQGVAVRSTTSVAILAVHWEPNETGQMGCVKVGGWVQDSYGSMTDYTERGFTIERSGVQLAIEDAPSQIIFHSQFLLRARITNAHNSSIIVDSHPVTIEISDAQRTVTRWDLSTVADGTLVQTIETDAIGTGTFTCNVTSWSSGDYLNTSVQFPFDVLKPSMLLVAALNATTYLAYYPGMSNCTALLAANLVCSSQIHDVSEANVTWDMMDKQGTLEYLGAQQFSGQVSMPDVPGQYAMSIHASLPNHESTNASLPVVVESREPVLYLTANRTQAAYGDFIRLDVRVVDKACQKPVDRNQVSVYVFAQTDWILLVTESLDNNGELTATWQAQDVGSQQQFRFRAVFHGTPQFSQAETALDVENTRSVRFLAASRVPFVRGKPATFTIRITTLDCAPMPDLGVELVEVLTNNTWCIATTNASGYAVLAWETPSEHELGEYSFVLAAADASGTQGCITVVLVFYDATVLRLA